MKKAHHDTLVIRLADMLVKLNQGECLDPKKLAEEFGVNVRTIQRDLNQRFAYLQLEKIGDSYRMEPTFLGKLSTRDIDRFASLAGIGGLFPSLSDDFLREIFNTRIESALLVKGHHYESIEGLELNFRELEQAITARRKITFQYSKNDGEKSYQDIEPYKMINQSGIWYLAALDNAKLKAYCFTRISGIKTLSQTFVIDPAINQKLEEEDGIWLSEEKKEVILKVDRDVAAYFKRRKLLDNQQIEKELEDGGLIISTKVAHQKQLYPIVRYWLPHLRIISPEAWQIEMEKELMTYLEH